MTSSSLRTVVRVVIGLGILAGVIYAVILYLRPVVTVARVFAGPAPKAVPGSVVVRAEDAREIKAEVEGRVLESTLDPGKKVKAGEVLLTIDPRELDLDIEKTESDLAAEKKRVQVGSSTTLDRDNAREALASTERLMKMSMASEADLTKQKRGLQAIEQKLELEGIANQQKIEGLENALKVKKLQREKMTIVAPFDGVISEVFARPKSLIGRGATIATLISTSRIVEAKVSEEDITSVRVGQKVQVRFLAEGFHIYEAVVTKKMPTADPETQRYIVHLNVTIDPEKLLPGITGEANIVVDEHPSQTIVPRRALFGNNLYVVKNGRVQLRQVELGNVSLTAVEILKGVENGEDVAVDQLDRLRDGDRVRITREEEKEK
jgi:RND family efflux transporter MFP subunit